MCGHDQPRIQKIVMGAGQFNQRGGNVLYEKLFQWKGGGGGIVGKLNEPIHHSHAHILY